MWKYHNIFKPRYSILHDMRFFTPDFFDEAPYSGPLISLLALLNFFLSRKFARIFATQGVPLSVHV